MYLCCIDSNGKNNISIVIIYMMYSFFIFSNAINMFKKNPDNSILDIYLLKLANILASSLLNNSIYGYNIDIIYIIIIIAIAICIFSLSLFLSLLYINIANDRYIAKHVSTDSPFSVIFFVPFFSSFANCCIICIFSSVV